MAAGGRSRLALQAGPEVGMLVEEGIPYGAGSEWKERPQGRQLRRCLIVAWKDRQVSEGKRGFAGWETETGPSSDSLV